MTVADIQQTQREVAINALRNGGRVLIVGYAADVWGRWRTHPRVVIWSDNELAHRKEVPGNVRLVLLTAALSHANANMVLKQCDKRNLHVFRYLQKSGEVKSMLEDMFPEEKPKPELVFSNTPTVAPPVVSPAPVSKIPRPLLDTLKPVATTKEGRVPYGEIPEFVAKYADWSLPSLKDIRKDLWPWIQKKFPTAKEGSVDQMLGKVKRDLHLQIGVKRPEKVISTLPEVQASVPDEKKALSPSTSTPSSVEIGLKMLDDAIAALQLAKEAYVEGMRYREENKKMKDQLRKLIED